MDQLTQLKQKIYVKMQQVTRKLGRKSNAFQVIFINYLPLYCFVTNLEKAAGEKALTSLIDTLGYQVTLK